MTGLGGVDLKAGLGRNRPLIRHSVRLIVASVAAYGLAQVFGLRQGQWAVITAIVVVQASLGASIKAVIDRFLGSLGGAAWGVLVSLAVPHHDRIGMGMALAAAVGPLAVIVAWKPAYRVAPLTAVILLLTPTLEAAPVTFALQRMLEIGFGSLVALGVSLFVLPARATRALTDAAAAALAGMADLIEALEGGAHGHPIPDPVQAIYDRIRAAIGRAEVAADETARERSSYLGGGPDPQPLCRTLRRLRHDLAMLGRAEPGPLPEAAATIMVPAVEGVAKAAAAFLRAAGAAITKTADSPSMTDLDRAFDAQAAAITKLRAAGVTRTLSDEALGRIFGLAFASEQLHRDLRDLVDRIDDLTRPAEAPAVADP